MATPKSLPDVENAELAKFPVDLKEFPVDLPDAFRPVCSCVSAETQLHTGRNGYPFRAKGIRKNKQNFRRIKHFFFQHGLFPHTVFSPPFRLSQSRGLDCLSLRFACLNCRTTPCAADSFHGAVQTARDVTSADANRQGDCTAQASLSPSRRRACSQGGGAAVPSAP